MDKSVIWQPQPRQAEFQKREEYEVLYGGAAGGGKSDALLAEALRQVEIPHYRGIIFRKTYPQISELVDRSMAMYKGAFADAEYVSSEHVWRFSSGAKIYFGAMQHEKDRHSYQGKSYDFIAFDELTHFTWGEYSYMFSRNRPIGPGTKVYMRAATNPGGIGHGWVKERFISPAPPMTPVSEEVVVPKPGGGMIRQERSRVFVPSTVFDIAALLENDPNYISNLALLPEAEKNALLYGSWDSFDGQVFAEWRNDPAHYADRRYTHVIKPFAIPKHWHIYRGFDFGYAKPFAVGWFAADPDGRIYHIKEYYGSDGRANVGAKLHPGEIAKNIAQIEAEDPMLKGRTILGIADPSIFDESRGESVARIMSYAPHLVYFTKADNTRIAGKMQFHYRLAFNEEGMAMFYVFDTCRNFIRTFPSLVYDSRNVEDVDTATEDHIYDMARYVLMERPISPRKMVGSKGCVIDDPLNLRREDKYRFYFI